jgi:DHA1 family multidrug resistance protein-like MFS transporter
MKLGSRSLSTREEMKADRAVRRVVLAVSASALAEWGGASAVLPLLPIYLRRHGSSDVLVGLTMAAFYAAAVLVQYPLGRLSDRIGRRSVQVGGLVTYAVATVLFVFVSAPLAMLFFRALQGAGAGVVDVANAATIGESVPERWRGRAFGTLYGTRTVGMAVGPFFGSLAGLAGMRWLFVGAAACSLVAAVPILRFTPSGARRPREARSRRVPLWHNRSVVGVALAFIAGGLVVGVYETCWSLLLTLRGAKPWELGLSWTLFAIPFAAMSLPAGWLVDHLDRRRLTQYGLLGSAFFAALYPFLHVVALLVALGSVEAIAVALATPAQSAQLAQSVAASDLGRAQGAVSTAQTAATALAATVAGGLFAVAAALPFELAALAIVLCVGGMGIAWRGVPGRGTVQGTESAAVATLRSVERVS